MPWPTERKKQTRKQILDSAVQLFTARGFNNVTVGDVMKNACLTHGGFYSYFSSKQELYAEAISIAARDSALAKFPTEGKSALPLLSQILSGYLDITHVKQEQSACPLAFLATDVANQEMIVRDTYTKVYKHLVALINKSLPVDIPNRRSRALALTGLMIGGVAVSRALNDERAVNSLLEACKAFAEEIIAGSTVEK